VQLLVGVSLYLSELPPDRTVVQYRSADTAPCPCGRPQCSSGSAPGTPGRTSPPGTGRSPPAAGCTSDSGLGREPGSTGPGSRPGSPWCSSHPAPEPAPCTCSPGSAGCTGHRTWGRRSRSCIPGCTFQNPCCTLMHPSPMKRSSCTGDYTLIHRSRLHTEDTHSCDCTLHDSGRGKDVDMPHRTSHLCTGSTERRYCS